MKNVTSELSKLWNTFTTKKEIISQGWNKKTFLVLYQDIIKFLNLSSTTLKEAANLVDPFLVRLALTGQVKSKGIMMQLRLQRKTAGPVFNSYKL